MLGSSDYGAQLAAHLGLPYAFAYFITDGQGLDEALQIYRETFRPRVWACKAHLPPCVSGPWPLTPTKKRWPLFKAVPAGSMDRNLGRIGALLPPEEAARDYSPAEQFALERLRESP
jgi:hypothetical protein